MLLLPTTGVATGKQSCGTEEATHAPALLQPQLSVCSKPHCLESWVQGGYLSAECTVGWSSTRSLKLRMRPWLSTWLLGHRDPVPSKDEPWQVRARLLRANQAPSSLCSCAGVTHGGCVVTPGPSLPSHSLHTQTLFLRSGGHETWQCGTLASHVVCSHSTDDHNVEGEHDKPLQSVSSVGACVVLQAGAGQGWCVLLSSLLYGLLPFPSHGSRVDPICSWRLFMSSGLELNCFYLPVSEDARQVPMSLVADGAGKGGLSSLCSASSFLVPFPQAVSPFIRSDLISYTAIPESCTTSDLLDPAVPLFLCGSWSPKRKVIGKGQVRKCPSAQAVTVLGPGSLCAKPKVAGLNSSIPCPHPLIPINLTSSFMGSLGAAV